MPFQSPVAVQEVAGDVAFHERIVEPPGETEEGFAVNCTSIDERARSATATVMLFVN